MAKATTRTAGRDPETIRQDIEGTRAEMSETIDELSNRLSPNHLADELWGRVRDGGDGIGAVLREHPVPLALMGLGLGWFAVEQATGHPVTAHRVRDRGVGPGTYAPAEGRRGPYRGDAIDHDSDGDEASTGSRMKAGVADAASERASRMGTAVRDRASEASERARAAGREARRGFRTVLDENPFALGAIAFGLGLAAGASAPTTAAEDRMMGRASDRATEEAKRMSREASHEDRDENR